MMQEIDARRIVRDGVRAGKQALRDQAIAESAKAGAREGYRQAVHGMRRRLRRYEDWPARLAAFMDARRTEPFSWGYNDCCRFAADAVEAIAGGRLMATYRYRSERGAKAALQRGGGLRQCIGRELGSEPRGNTNLARRGDVVLFLGDHDQETVGICLGAEIASPGPDGLRLTPMRKAIAAWEIG